MPFLRNFCVLSLIRESEPAHDSVNDHHEIFHDRKALMLGTQSELPPIAAPAAKSASHSPGVRGKNENPAEFRSIQIGIGAVDSAGGD